jgi:diguanylate cyclase (GGDEF)-like protein
MPIRAVDRPQTDPGERIAEAMRARRQALANDLADSLDHEWSGSLPDGFVSAFAAALLDVLIAGVEDDRRPPAEPLDVLHECEGLLGTRAFLAAVSRAEFLVADDLAPDGQVGATSDVWPEVVHRLRHAAFGAVAGCVEGRARAGTSDVVDRLTTTLARPVFDLALAREVERAERYGRPMALLLFDVDHLARVNQRSGRGVGDLVLERLGILLRLYFRRQDWVARHGADSFVVLLSETKTDDALRLAEGARAAVEQRLHLEDYRTGELAQVTVSAGLAAIPGKVQQPGRGSIPAPNRVLEEAEQAAAAALAAGGNRVQVARGLEG